MAPSQTAESEHPDSIYYDRFGNTYDRLLFDAYFDGLNNSRSLVGYFDLRFNIENHDLIPTIEDVFEYISNAMEQRTNTTGCSDEITPSLVRILIKDDDLPHPVLATGSPMYYGINRSNCDEVVINLVDLKMNGGLNYPGVDGMIILDSNSVYPWYLGAGSPSSNEVDFYSVILHEALHLFGFGSRLIASGTALDGGFSVWDQFIHTSAGYINGGPSPNIEPVIISDCEENCWILNDDLFEDAGEFIDSLELNCLSGGVLDFVFGDDAIAPLAGGSGDVGSALSHLHETCNGQNVNYVMQPGITLGESRRTITSDELSILCRLGYMTQPCNECYLTVLPEDIRYPAFLSCCSTFIDACVDQEIVLYFDDLMCNDFSGDLTEITNYYLPAGSDLQVNMTGSSFEVTPTEQGNHILFYTVRGCDCRLLDGWVYIFTGPCTDCEEADPCENLVCIDDFEDFEPGYGLNAVHVQASGGFWYAETGDNSLDICQDTTGNQFLHISSFGSNREGLIMHLSEPLEPGCTLHVQYDASVGEQNTFNWFVSENPPCSYNLQDVYSNGQPADCGSHLFQPFLIKNDLIANIPDEIIGLCTPDPNFDPYTVTWPHDLGAIDFNYLILFPAEKNNDYARNYIDNIVVTKDCLDPDFYYEVNNENCLEIQFLLYTDHDSTDHYWDFGDSNNSSSDTPIHEYGSGGSYTVTHTVTDQCGNSQSSSLDLVTDCCNDYTVTADETWTTGNSIPNNGVFNTLTILQGVSLSVGPGVVLRFCPEGSMVVEAGAFVRNQGTLTSLSEMEWMGVFVEGVPAANQFPNCSLYSGSVGCIAQGYYWGDSGSIIENAIIGLRNYGPGFNEHGGILRGIEATFRNNGIGIDFMPYQNFSGSQPSKILASLTDCVFESTSGFIIATPFTHFARLNGVNGVRFSGCIFENRLIPADAQEYGDFGIGIYADGAGFEVRANNPNVPCLPPNTCGSFPTFKGLGHGIYVSNMTMTRPYSIVQAQIDSCWRGITSDGGTGGTILFNTFNLGGTPVQFNVHPEDQIGIQLEGDHTGFEIQESEFINDPEGETKTIGIRCHDLGTATNIIRRNRFDDLDIVHEAFGINALNSEINSSGLVYLCEDIADTYFKGFDFYIAETGGIDNIYYIQAEPIDDNGIDFLPPGTEFANTAIDIYNANGATPPFYESIYYHWFDAGNQEPLTGQGYVKFEREFANPCEELFCMPPCIDDEDLADVKGDYFGHRDQLEEDIEDYWTAIGNSNYTLAAEKNLSAVFHTQKAFGHAYDLVQYYWHDTTSFHFDTLLDWYGRLNTFGSDLMVAGELASSLEYEDALDYLEDIPSNRELTEEQEADLDRVIAIYGILDTTTIPDLSPSQRNIIRSIAQDSKGRSSGIARSVLHHFGERFPLPYFMGEQFDPPLQRRSEGPKNDLKEDIRGFAVLPNPAGDLVRIIWNDKMDLNKVRYLIVTNLLGQRIRSFSIPEGEQVSNCDISQIPGGMYVVSALDGAGRVCSELIVIR